MNSNYRILILFLLLNLLNYGQNENRFWCFGKKAGLDFGSNPPSVYNLSQMIGYEGCSTISDANGNLLFYTAGDTVWNKQNQIMAKIKRFEDLQTVIDALMTALFFLQISITYFL